MWLSCQHLEQPQYNSHCIRCQYTHSKYMHMVPFTPRSPKHCPVGIAKLMPRTAVLDGRIVNPSSDLGYTCREVHVNTMYMYMCKKEHWEGYWKGDCHWLQESVCNANLDKVLDDHCIVVTSPSLHHLPLLFHYVRVLQINIIVYIIIIICILQLVTGKWKLFLTGPVQIHQRCMCSAFKKTPSNLIMLNKKNTADNIYLSQWGSIYM